MLEALYLERCWYIILELQNHMLSAACYNDNKMLLIKKFIKSFLWLSDNSSYTTKLEYKWCFANAIFS